MSLRRQLALYAVVMVVAPLGLAAAVLLTKGAAASRSLVIAVALVLLVLGGLWARALVRRRPGDRDRLAAALAAREEELRVEQGRLAAAKRWIGRTFAANLDREVLLEIAVRTAMDGTGAEGGRARAGAHPSPLVVVGVVDGLDAVLAEAEAETLRTGTASGVHLGAAAALAHPLSAVTQPSARTGVIAVARSDRAFTRPERDALAAAARQASISLGHVELHETVERQATTDELTGISNRRRFQEALELELKRSSRFDLPVALVMLDIDDFKLVNDTYGHQTGDAVLREIGRLLRENSRDIDEPARYGGEEFAVVLPGTNLEGAVVFAERTRTAMEALRLPLPGGGELRVTASFGAATHPPADGGVPGLVAAADAALYEAKRTGKNRTIRALDALMG